jgi:diamine N-acetyltransferase
MKISDYIVKYRMAGDNVITLREVTQDNIFKVIQLWNTLDDSQKKSVAPNAVSLAQAYVNQERAWPRAIYLNEEPIGFVMMALHDDDIPEADQPAYFLWRFMIAKPYQSQGYGRLVIETLKQKAIQDGMKYLYVTCTMHEVMPYKFYINCGFEDTHEMDDDEQILKMAL